MKPHSPSIQPMTFVVAVLVAVSMAAIDFSAARKVVRIRLRCMFGRGFVVDVD